MEQNTSKVGAMTLDSKNKGEIKGKRFGRGAVESGLTHECGVFGVVGCGSPTAVSFKALPERYQALHSIILRLTLRKQFVSVLLHCSIVVRSQLVLSRAMATRRRTSISTRAWA